MTIQLLNLGCGCRYHNEWNNIDFHSTGKGVIAYNLLKGIPFKDNNFDMVYHSHIIEHFQKDDAPKFLGECYRVLKPNGIIRIAFPDLEKIVYHYIRLLNELKNGNSQHEADYDWIMLLMYDQTTRNVSGGEMLKYIIRESIPNEKFVLDCCGTDIKYFIETRRNNNVKHMEGDRIDLLRYFKRKAKKLLHETNKIIFGKKYLALQIGKFRLSGEVHQWMYDTFSLSRLLETAGFKQIVIRDAYTSYLNNWHEFNLDTEPDGTIYKHDSSYIEGIK